MSKIAKQKANQWILKHKDGDVLYVQDAYIAAYDQAFKDFMEKAEEAISQISCHFIGEDYTFDQVWEQFKNYMEDEM